MLNLADFIAKIDEFRFLLLILIFILTFLDSERSRPPIAETMDETRRGTMRHLSILRKSSPGNWTYIRSRSVHLELRTKSGVQKNIFYTFLAFLAREVFFWRIMINPLNLESKIKLENTSVLYPL